MDLSRICMTRSFLKIRLKSGNLIALVGPLIFIFSVSLGGIAKAKPRNKVENSSSINK